jgi:cytidyltransferase-like protein
LDRKRVIGAAFCQGIGGKGATVGAIAERLGIDGEDAEKEVENLASRGYLRSQRGRVFVTTKGRRSIKVVFIGGGFEVIHRGHLYTLEKAKSLGDVLVVSVARDSTLRRRKGREPVAGEKERAKLVGSLRQVDAAILGVEGDIYETLEKVWPDVVALGYDQYHIESEVSEEGARRGMKLKVVRLDSPHPEVKTSTLLSES